jgi:hypothetical protein
MRQDDQYLRRAVRWPARYRPECDSTWTPCRVIDASLDGAALALPVGASAPTGPLIVEVLMSGYRARISLRAEVRNNVQTQQGFERVGVRFVSPTIPERRALERLLDETGAAPFISPALKLGDVQ